MSFVFLLINKTLQLNNLKTRPTMNAKVSVFVICVEAIIYLLLYNLHDCTFKENTENKNKKLSQARRRIESKTPKRKHPNKKCIAKTYSTNVKLDVNFSIIPYGNSHCVEFSK